MFRDDDTFGFYLAFGIGIGMRIWLWRTIPPKQRCGRENQKLDNRIFVGACAVSAVGTDGGLRGTCHAGERDKHPHGSNRTVASDLKSPSLYHAAPPYLRLFRFYKSRERISRSPLSEEEAS